MDVAIRAVNMLVAYDLLRAYGAEFTTAFDRIFTRSLYHHAQFVATHLEYQTAWRSNHYLADVIGLLIIAAYLPASSRTDLWLHYGLQEMAHELRYQFYEDGTNFEASTAYHQLSGEFVAYGIAYALALSPERRAAVTHIRNPIHTFPISLKPIDWSQLIDVSRLLRIRQFVADVTTPLDNIALIGDEDGGRFLKLFPVYKRMTTAQVKAQYENLRDYTTLPPDASYLDETIGDAHHLHDALTGLFVDLPAVSMEGRLVRRTRRRQRAPYRATQPAKSAKQGLAASG